MFIDGTITLATLHDKRIDVGIEDWMPGIIATLGLIT
jgi:hypothetical protein